MSSPQTTSRPRPFIRWAGSKRLLVPEIRPFIPETYATYYEPFLGGGSLYLSLQPPVARLGDALTPLIETWQTVRDDVEQLILTLEGWAFSREQYDHLKHAAFSSPAERAAQFLFLNRGAYGGLWRLNSSGRFNVPWSEPKTTSPTNTDNLRAVAQILNRGDIELSCGDFATITSTAGPNDLVFLDPPYSKGRAVRPFIHYNESLFDWDHQVRLAAEATRLAGIGATVIVTNSTHPEILPLYEGFRRYDVVRHSSLGSRANSSTTLAERIFVSH